MITEPLCSRSSGDVTLTMLFSLSVCLQTSVLHMCSLFHAFMFAQLWTIYCEQAAAVSSNQNQNEFSSGAILTGLEFWSRVTPSILQLMAHNKVVNLTLLSQCIISLVEAVFLAFERVSLLACV